MGWMEDTVALVTGAGSGLGRAIVERYLSEGAQVAALEINEDKAAALLRDFGTDICVTIGDVTEFDDNVRAVDDAVSAFGRLDVFVGNAGLWDFGLSLETLDSQRLSKAFDEIFAVNVKACLFGAKAVLPQLRETKGAMIFTVSNAGFWPGGGGPLYVSSKHAVMGLIKQLAYELCPDVRVNGVAPGGMSSDLRGPPALGLDNTAISDLPIDELMRKFSPLERSVRPADYTGHYVLLASRDNASTVTGSVHNCDGGVGIRGRRELEERRQG